MARIRSIKPDFFRDEDLAVFSFAHRLLFIGLWNLSDRRGLLEDRPRRIHADLFPFDPSLDVDAMLTDLAEGLRPFILRYTVNGRRFIAVINFLKHQRPHKTEPESVIPQPDAADNLHSPLDDEQSTLLNARKGREGKGNDQGREGKGEGVTRLSPLRASPETLSAAWNDLTSRPIPQCRELTAQRRTSAQKRLEERDLAEWQIVIGRINASAFCRGENARGWVATFDWLLKPDTAVKVLEGKYDTRPKHVEGSRTGDTVEAGKAYLRERFEQLEAEDGGSHVRALKG